MPSGKKEKLQDAQDKGREEEEKKTLLEEMKGRTHEDNTQDKNHEKTTKRKR